MKLSLYRSGQETGPPVAEVSISDRREQACRLPTHVDPGARFFLQRVETDDPVLEQQLLEVLTRDSIRVNRATAKTRGPVRTRGDYLAQEPYGTPAYWRAVLGGLPVFANLQADRRDLASALVEMDRAVPDQGAAPQTSPQAISLQPALEPELETEPEPRPDKPSLLDTVADLLRGRPAPALAGEGDEDVKQPAGPRSVEPSPDLEAKLEEIQNDPALRPALSNLLATLDDPALRPRVLAALEAWARVARSDGQT